MKPHDLLIVGYLNLTLLFCPFIEGGWILGLRHVALIALIYWLFSGSSVRTALRTWYSLLLVPLLYFEVETLSQVAGGRVYDPWVEGWEHVLFGQPSPAMWLSEVWNSLILSEWLHFCYLCYHLLHPVTALIFYRYLSERKFETYLCCVNLAWLLAYLVQCVFPVMGPRLIYPPLAEELQGPVWWVCHYLSGQGAAHAAAFPSGHVTLACCVLIAVWRWFPKALWVFAPVCSGLVVATVYGRFHYVVDLVAGVALAWLAMSMGPRIYQKLEGKEWPLK